MGAWIEIDEGFSAKDTNRVASYMGAWIEITPSCFS